MCINLKETQVMHMSRNGGKPLSITADGTKLDQVQPFVYLRSTVTED